MLPEDLRSQRGSDGLADYLNAQIYIADNATPDEIAAAANIAARLAFDARSMDLPMGFAISEYRPTEVSLAIIVGTAALRFTEAQSKTIVFTTDGSRSVVAIPNLKVAERFARTLGAELAISTGHSESATTTANRLTLSGIFGSSGILRQRIEDFLPEQTDTAVLLGPATHAIEVIDLAARIAHEAAGIQIPMVVANPDYPLLENVIAVGYSSLNSQALVPGQGRIEISELNPGTAVSITGADGEGLSHAVKHAAERLPYVWDYGKNCLSLSQVEYDLRRFFEIRSPAGQAAAALCKARQSVLKLTPQELKSASLEVLVDGDCRKCLNYIASQFPGLNVSAENLAVQSGPLIFEDTFSLPWEGDEALRRIQKYVIPEVHSGSQVEIELRVSESPEVRALLAARIRKKLLEASVSTDLEIRVLSAHKQAYFWIDECLKPKLMKAKRVRIQYCGATDENSPAIEDENRWLHELYPIDEILSRNLGIPLDNITFVKSALGRISIYEVIAEDNEGRVLLHETFEPKFVMRPMFDAFPDYANVRVSTGWLFARVDGTVVADDRIVTDTENFWNNYQSSTLPKIRDYIQRLYDGKPRAECAPYFGVLEVEVRLSEPDYRIDVGEERISTLEALHEDIYFETLLFLELLGLNNPGRIIPRVQRSRDCEDGSALIRFTGKPGPNPRLQLTWKSNNGENRRFSEDLLPIANGKAAIRSIVVHSGRSTVSLEIAGVTQTAENLALLSAIREFHEHGIGLEWLSYERVDVLSLGTVEIPQTSECFRQPRIEPLPATGNEIVQWDTPIDPVECMEVIRKLAAFPQIQPYQAGTSYLGRAIWALDVVDPLKGKYVSQAKASLSKPVLFVTGRQHANEVSSTSHILKLAELLATDVETRKLLDRVHVVLHPMTNPDGAALVDELRRETPDFMLHAGYLGALGSDVTTEQWSENPLYPEAHVRPKLWKAWLPDIVLNPHGYPSHEWVQLFAGYTAWVKSRSLTARDWWIPRGWFIPRFEFMEQSREAAFHLRHALTDALSNSLGDWNDDMYRRYAKYNASGRTNFESQFINNLLICTSSDGSDGLKQSAAAFTFMQRYPQVTFLETVTEVPDEVAHGVWLKTMAQAGLDVSLACLRYLAENHQPFEHTTHHQIHATKLRICRKRP